MSSRGKRPGRRGKPRPRPRKATPSYHIQQTDKDMLLLIPSREDLDETVVVVRKRIRVPTPEGEEVPGPTDPSWGSLVPAEILHRIFRLLAHSEGAVPIMCRLSQVCRLWRQVASSPDLWRRVTLSRCWVLPGPKDPPRLQKKVTQSAEALIRERLPQVSDFSLHHWKSLVPCVLQSVAACCPLLVSLTLSHCSLVTAEDLRAIGRRCPLLDSLNLQNSKVQTSALPQFLEENGLRLRRLLLSYTAQMNTIMAGIVGGWCPELRLLEVDLPLDSAVAELHLPIEGLQASCPKLEVLRLLNLLWQARPVPRLLAGVSGFPELQELCLATSRYSSVSDAVLQRLLCGATKLRVLDLRGCYKISPQGLTDLPCTDLEHLFLGLYCSISMAPSAVSGVARLARRWRHSLQEVDLAAQSYPEDDLQEALRSLSQGAANETLRSLNLSGTRVTGPAVRDALLGCHALTHLDLSSCRNIPRGLKRAYRGRPDLELCAAELTKSLQEEDS